MSGVQNDIAIGRQLTELEEGIKKLGVPYTLVIYRISLNNGLA